MRTRLSVLLLCTIVFMLLAGCASPARKADPRTITFPPLDFSIPQSVRFDLSNGMTVYLMTNHELPLVNMTAYINVGSSYEPAEKTGLASLTGAVMRSGGTAEFPPKELDATLEFMASSVESSIGSDAGTVSMATLKRNLERTLYIYAQVLMVPAFNAERVELARKQALEGIRRQNDDPKEIANRELSRVLYAGSPLGRVPTVETVNAISREDMVAFHRSFYTPNNVVLAVSGDIDQAELFAMLEMAFAGWQRREVTLPAVSPPSSENRPEVLYARKEVNQSVIRMGHLGIDKNNPDLYAIRVMDYILGGGFTSRLVTEVRSNQGLAYNVDSSFDVGRRFVGTFRAVTETKSGSTVKAITLMRRIITGMTEQPVTDQELSLAKESIINSFIFGFARPDAVVNQQARLEFYGYQPGYLENYRANIAKVSKEDVLRVARMYLHPEAMKIVVVGDETTFDAPLAELGPVRRLKLDNGN